MSLSALILLAWLCRASYGITCYECSHLPDEFPGIVTVDNIPKEIRNCSFVEKQTTCMIDVRLRFTLDHTGINIEGDPDPQEPEHTLRATTLLEGVGVVGQWQHSFVYRCSTDRCNDFDRFTLLLRSLTLQSDLPSLQKLIEPQTPFDGNWCRLASNQTTDDCPSPVDVDPKNCQQCLALFAADAKATTLCASCFTRSDEKDETIQTETIFDLTDRSQRETWTIYCSAPDCNGLQTNARVRAARTIGFDFDRFFGSNHGQRLSVFSFSHLLLLSVITKTFY